MCIMLNNEMLVPTSGGRRYVKKSTLLRCYFFNFKPLNRSLTTKNYITVLSLSWLVFYISRDTHKKNWTVAIRQANLLLNINDEVKSAVPKLKIYPARYEMSTVTTLLVNANPLMRYDDYYVLSDLI